MKNTQNKMLWNCLFGFHKTTFWVKNDKLFCFFAFYSFWLFFKIWPINYVAGFLSIAFVNFTLQTVTLYKKVNRTVYAEKAFKVGILFFSTEEVLWKQAEFRVFLVYSGSVDGFETLSTQECFYMQFYLPETKLSTNTMFLWQENLWAFEEGVIC